MAGYRAVGSRAMSERLKVPDRAIFRRRRNLEKKYGIALDGPNGPPEANVDRMRGLDRIPGRVHDEMTDGVVLVGSDAHFWPGIRTTAFRGFLHLCRELKPKIVVKNGDALDFPRISRHPPIGWEQTPEVIQEIECTQERLGEIEQAAGKARRYWPAGNHDLRYETRLAQVAPEYAKVHGIHLKDHFPLWEPCWSLWINDHAVVKHRFRGGIHATWNNTVYAGKTIITGHLHSLQVRPFTDYNGTRWGVDTGTMADPFGPQFEYLEDNPRNWRAGFIVLTFHKGRLLTPEMVNVIGEDEIEFRGKAIHV